MAVTVSLYNHTPKLFANGEVTLASLKLMLLNDSATFDATDVYATDVSSSGTYEVSGNGWDAGGEAISGAAVTTVTTNDAKLDADDMSVNASGGDIGPAYKAVIIDGSYSPALALVWIDFGEAQTAGSGTPFAVTWNASGIISWTNAS